MLDELDRFAEDVAQGAPTLQTDAEPGEKFALQQEVAKMRQQQEALTMQERFQQLLHTPNLEVLAHDVGAQAGQGDLEHPVVSNGPMDLYAQCQPDAHAWERSEQDRTDMDWEAQFRQRASAVQSLGAELRKPTEAWHAEEQELLHTWSQPQPTDFAELQRRSRSKAMQGLTEASAYAAATAKSAPPTGPPGLVSGERLSTEEAKWQEWARNVGLVAAQEAEDQEPPRSERADAEEDPWKEAEQEWRYSSFQHQQPRPESQDQPHSGAGLAPPQPQQQDWRRRWLERRAEEERVQGAQAQEAKAQQHSWAEQQQQLREQQQWIQNAQMGLQPQAVLTKQEQWELHMRLPAKREQMSLEASGNPHVDHSMLQLKQSPLLHVQMQQMQHIPHAQHQQQQQQHVEQQQAALQYEQQQQAANQMALHQQWQQQELQRQAAMQAAQQAAQQTLQQAAFQDRQHLAFQQEVAQQQAAQQHALRQLALQQQVAHQQMSSQQQQPMFAHAQFGQSWEHGAQMHQFGQLGLLAQQQMQQQQHHDQTGGNPSQMGEHWSPALAHMMVQGQTQYQQTHPGLY